MPQVMVEALKKEPSGCLRLRSPTCLVVVVVQVGTSEIVSPSSLCNLEVWFDKNMSINAHVGVEGL